MSAKPPDEAQLYEAALNHLNRYAATEASLARVLARKIDRWARLYAERDADPENHHDRPRAALNRQSHGLSAA